MQNSVFKEIENVTIIGTGPAGYTAAIYTARANLEPLCLEGDQPGGQLTITTDIENYPGFPEAIAGGLLMDSFRKQAERFGPRVVSGSVVKADLSKRPFTLELSNGKKISTRTVIIATGASAKWLGLPSEKRLQGKGVSACATCDGFFFRNLNVAVVGGGDTAMEEATFLTRFAMSVTIIHRREKFRASKIMIEKAQKNPKIQFMLDSAIDEILGDNSVTSIRVKNLKTGEMREIPMDGVFMGIGHEPNTGPFKGQIACNEAGYIVPQPGSSKTSVVGVFAAGDVADHVYRQAITAAGTGCMAAIDAERFLEEEGK